MEQQYFIHKDLVYIQHLETQGFLTDTGISYQNGYIVGTQSDNQKNVIWILEKYSPPAQGIKKPHYDNVEIWPNDMIVIRNAKSGNVLTWQDIVQKSNYGNKSMVTKQGEILVSNQYEGSGEQQFLLHIDDIANLSFNKVRIVNVLDGNLALHSHKKPYKNPKDVNEVTGYSERDQNDYWSLISVSKELRQSIFKKEQSTERIVNPRYFKYIHNSDKVVIRNCFTGGTLHSHSVFNTHGNKSQEVTWRYSIKRDSNDWWIMELAADRDITSSITNKAMITLLHSGTGKKLMHIKEARNKKKDFLEVTCGLPSEADFLVEGLDMGIPDLNTLIMEYPFRLKCVKTSQYLAALDRPSSKTTFQGEVALVGTRDQNTIWMIEAVDSLFD